MSLGLLLPMALAALAALALPLLVHLVRRTEDRPVLFAALRWLRPADQPRQRRRFDEWLLLALRLLLLALLALWLAQPVLHGHRDLRPWLLVVPGADAARAPVLPDAERRWLAPGLPPLDDPMPRDEASLASLLRDADASIPPDAPITVLVPERIVRTDAQRPRLTRTVEWIVTPGRQSAIAATPAPWRIAVRHDGAHAAALPYLRAVAAAWEAEAKQARHAPPALDIAETTAPVPAQASHAIWLSTAPVPESLIAWTRDGGQLLLAHDTPPPDPGAAAWMDAWHADDATPLAQASPLGRGRLLRLLAPLQPASLPLLLDGDFPRQFAQLLSPMEPQPTHALAADWMPLAGAAAATAAPLPLQPWLALVLALVFAMERIVAMRAGRQVRA